MGEISMPTALHHPVGGRRPESPLRNRNQQSFQFSERAGHYLGQVGKTRVAEWEQDEFSPNAGKGTASLVLGECTVSK
jgi:hypothetical protein